MLCYGALSDYIWRGLVCKPMDAYSETEALAFKTPSPPQKRAA